MSNFAPIYTNHGGKNIINTLQRKHVIAVLNAKSIVKQSLHSGPTHSLSKTDLPKKKKANDPIRISSQRPFSPNPPFSLKKINTLTSFMNNPHTQVNEHHGEVKSLLRNLISIDKKSINNIKNLRKSLKLQKKKEKTEAKAQKKKIFYVTDFFSRKEGGGLTVNTKKSLDKMIPSSEKLGKQFQIPVKKGKVRCFSATSKKSLNVPKDFSRVNLKAAELMISTKIKEDKTKELFESVDELLAKSELSACKKRIILHLMRNQIIEMDAFLELKKEILNKYEGEYHDQVKLVLEEIENHIFK